MPVKYHKILIISSELIFIHKAYLMDLFSRTANIGEGEGREAIIGRSGVLWGEWREGEKFLRFKFWFFSSKCAVDVTKNEQTKTY